MIKSIYDKIIKQGFSSSYTSKKNKRIELLNTYALIWMHFTILFPVSDLLTREVTRQVVISAIAQLITLLSMIMVIVFNKFSFFKVARFLWIFTAFLNFFSFSIFILPGKYMEYYYVLIPGIALSLYTKNKIPWLTLIIGFILFLTPYYFMVVYPEDYIARLEVPAMLGVFLSLFFLVNYFKKLNLANEEKLSKAYENLAASKKSEVAHLQLKSLKAQMNPHFMFNAMNSIQNLVLKGDKNEAYNYLTKFSSMIRENLNMSEKSFVSFDEELSLLNKYLELEKLRFKNDFEYFIEGVNDGYDIKIPAMIIQPFVENAIKHGLLHKMDGLKKIQIKFSQKNKILICIITDNGIGLKAAKKINEQNSLKQNSFSTNAIHQRLAFLKDYYKTDIGFTYLPSPIGVKVEIRIPYAFDTL